MHFTDSRREIESSSGTTSSAGRTPFTLFGRDAELGKLEGLCETLRLASSYGSEDYNNRPPMVALLRGPSGCGKTELAKEFGRRADYDGFRRDRTSADFDFDFVPTRGREVVFVSGKVDQFQQQLAFAPIVQALDEVADVLLKDCEQFRFAGCNPSEGGSSDLAKGLNRVRRLLLHEGKTLVPMVPNLTRFMEKCEDDNACSTDSSVEKGVAKILPVLDSESCYDCKVMTERLICLAIQSFVRLFVRIHPLVWFVDDLQWADDSSLRLLQTLVKDHQLAHVLFVMGYRDVLTSTDESDCAGRGEGPRMELVNLWKDTVHKIDIPLENLSLDVIIEWFAHLLSTNAARVRPLADLVHSKTEGNPYFCLNYLEFLQRKQLLRFRYQTKTWEWNLFDVLDPPRQRQSGGGNGCCGTNRPTNKPLSLEEVVVMQIASLPPLVQQLLQIAACLGYYFDETLLKRLLQTCDSLLLMGFSHMTALCSLNYHEDEDSTCTNPQNESCEENEEANRTYLKALYQAEEGGLIRPTRVPKIYQFAHDRVQQIVYKAMANDKEVALLHLRIGKHIQEMDDDQYSLDAADQLNRGSILLVHEMERLELVELNLEVSALACERGGINLMTHYLEKAVSLVKERDWTHSYSLAIEVFTLSAEAEANRGRYAKSEECICAILANAKCADDTIRARFVRMQSLGIQGFSRQAVRESRSLLTELGERLPPSNRMTCVMEFKRTRRILQDKSDSDLLRLAPMTDKTQLWIAKILHASAVFSWNCNPSFASLVFMRLMSHCLLNGSCEFTPFAFSSYGSFAASMGFEELGSRFADLARRLVKDKSEYLWTAICVYSNLNHLKNPFREGLSPLLAAYRIGLETGDLQMGGHCLAAYAMLYHICGRPLRPFVESIRNYVSQLQLCGQDLALAFVVPSLQLALNLLGETSSPIVLSLEACKEHQHCSKDFNFDESATPQTCMHYFQALNAYILGDLQLARHAIERAKFVKIPGTHASNIFHAFIDGLVCMALYRKTGRKKYLRCAARATSWIANLAEKQPHNCSGMHLLLQAEKGAATLSDIKRTRNLYVGAIKKFDQEGFLHFGAIANERASEFMSRCGDDRRQSKFLSQAKSLYMEWGATVKLTSLEDQLRKLDSPVRPSNTKEVPPSLRSWIAVSSDFLSERLTV